TISTLMNNLEEYLYYFFLHDTATTSIYTLSLHDALPISKIRESVSRLVQKDAQLEIMPAELNQDEGWKEALKDVEYVLHIASPLDRKSTRLNSSHVKISYAVFCLKKKKNINNINIVYLI